MTLGLLLCPGWIDTPETGHNRCARPAGEPHERHVDETGQVEWTDPPWQVWVGGVPLPPAPAFSPRGRTVFGAMWYGLVDGTRFGLRWAWRRLMGPPD